MEGNIIDAIYLGNLNPNEHMRIKDPEFLKLENNVAMLESRLNKQLGSKEKPLFDSFLDTYGSRNALEVRLRFMMTSEKLAEMLPEAFVILAKKEPDGWAKEALDFCRERGYMIGDETGNQQPMKPLLRQEAAQIIMKITGDK